MARTKTAGSAATHARPAIDHDGARVPIEMHLKLARFAGGCSSPTERSEVKKLLLEDPELIPLLVAKLHALRAEIATP